MKPRDYVWVLAMSAVAGLFIGYCACTYSMWDIDNQFPSLHRHMTLKEWIKVNQIDHLRRNLHELW